MSCAILPKEVSFIILEFCGIVKNRNGTYISQIPKTDVRYSLLQTLPKPRDSLDGQIFNGDSIITSVRVDFEKIIDYIQYNFTIIRVYANPNHDARYQIIEFFEKWRQNKRITRDFHEYV